MQPIDPIKLIRREEYDENMEMCTNTIMQLIKYLNIPDDLLGRAFENISDLPLENTINEITNVDSELEQYLSTSLSQLLSSLYHESEVNTSDSLFTVFHNLILLFLQVMMKKDEEISICRSRQSPSVISTPNSELINYLYSRINDLSTANQDLSYFYNFVIEYLQSSSNQSESIVNEVISTEIEELMNKLAEKDENIQTEKENSKELLLQLTEEKKKCNELEKNLEDLRIYANDKKRFDQNVENMKNSYQQEETKLRKMNQELELSVIEKERRIEELQNQLTEKEEEMRLMNEREEEEEIQQEEKEIQQQEIQQQEEEENELRKVNQDLKSRMIEKDKLIEELQKILIEKEEEMKMMNEREKEVKEEIPASPPSLQSTLSSSIPAPPPSLQSTLSSSIPAPTSHSIPLHSFISSSASLPQQPLFTASSQIIPQHQSFQTSMPLLSQSMPITSSSTEDEISVYKKVIRQLHHDVLSLQREKKELERKITELEEEKIEKPVVLSGNPKKEDWNVADCQRITIQNLEKKIHEQNTIINNQREQIISLRDNVENDQVNTKENEQNKLIIQEKEKEIQSLQASNQQLIQEKEEELKLLETTNQQLIQEKEEELKLLETTNQQLIQKNSTLQSLLSSYQQSCQSILSLQNGLCYIKDQVNSFSSHYSTDLVTLNQQYSYLTSSISQYRNKLAYLSNELQNYKGNYRVIIRVRPVNQLDTTDNICLQFHDDFSLSIHSETPKLVDKSFCFDRVFTPITTQEEVFAEIEPIVYSIFSGMNACILAYGQTGAGKTYTMSGEGNKIGIIPRCSQLLLDQLYYRKDLQLIMKMSISELYNENIRDLLNNGEKVNVTSYSGHYLKEMEVHSIEEVLNNLQLGNSIRATGQTKMNEHSSRSHMLVTFYLYKQDDSLFAKLTLVDLAGSENLKQSDVEGDRQKEARSINLSLFELTNVLRDLTVPNKTVIYRNSKLTMMLKDCLGGKSKNVVLIQLSPTSRDFSASLNSLLLGEKISSIKLGDVRARKSIGKQYK